MNKRADRTQKKIQETFELLLAEKPYEEITIEEIALRAGRSRITVYRHYGGKEELLQNCFTTVIEEIKDQIISPTEAVDLHPSLLSYTNLVILFKHVAEHRFLYQALFSNTSSFRTGFRRVFAGILIRIMDQGGNLSQLSAPSDIICNLMAEMIVGSIAWWLESNKNYEPAVMAEIVVRLAETGVFGFTGQVPMEEDISYRPFEMDKRPLEDDPSNITSSSSSST